LLLRRLALQRQGADVLRRQPEVLQPPAGGRIGVAAEASSLLSFGTPRSTTLSLSEKNRSEICSQSGIGFRYSMSTPISRPRTKPTRARSSEFERLNCRSPEPSRNGFPRGPYVNRTSSGRIPV
jgi:hypothetical protein